MKGLLASAAGGLACFMLLLIATLVAYGPTQPLPLAVNLLFATSLGVFTINGTVACIWGIIRTLREDQP